MTETERETVGRGYMALAIQYGHIELQTGLSLYSGSGLKSLGMKEKKSGKPFIPTEPFYFMTGNVFSECYDPCEIIDRMNAQNERAIYGFELPITYKGIE